MSAQDFVVVDVALGGVDLETFAVHPRDPVILFFVARQAARNDLHAVSRQAPAHRRADSAHTTAYERDALFEGTRNVPHRLRAGARAGAS